MTEKDWEKFFELVDKIVDLPMPARDKAIEVEAKAEEYGSSTNFYEFCGWFGD